MKQYNLICREDLKNFKETVNQMLAEGWELHGNTFVGHYSDDTSSLFTFAFCQAFIKNTID